MKKLLIFVVIMIGLFSVVHAQTVEVYPNSDRYFFQPRDPTLRFQVYGIISPFDGGNPFEFNHQYIISHKYFIDSLNPLPVYGVVIPFVPTVHHFGDTVFGYHDEHWNIIVKYHELLNGTVYLMQSQGTTDDTLVIVDTAHFRMGASMLTGNFFQIPETYLNYYFMTNTYPVMEVYFSQPHIMTEDFWLGAPASLESVFGIYELLGLQNDELLRYHMLWASSNKTIPNCSDQYSISDDCTIANQTYDGLDQTFWSAPFPITAPPPCMPPWNLEVKGQRKRQVDLEWQQQYGNQWYELEYGPMGFAEGSGTVVGPIMPGADHRCRVTLDSLVMDADYTVRVRSNCGEAGVYTGWEEVDFHTGVWYTLQGLVNNESWGRVEGGGDYLPGATAKLTAWPLSGEHPFVNWNDGSNQNPRSVTVTCDTVFKAYFVGNEGVAEPEGSVEEAELYPNPATSTVTVEAPCNISRLAVCDIRGRMMAELRPETPTATMDISSWPRGIYLLTVSTPQGTTTKKLVLK